MKKRGWFMRQTKRATEDTSEHCADPWKQAVIEACIVAEIYTQEYEDNPRKALNDLIAWHIGWCAATMRPLTLERVKTAFWSVVNGQPTTDSIYEESIVRPFWEAIEAKLRAQEGWRQTAGFPRQGPQPPTQAEESKK